MKKISKILSLVVAFVLVMNMIGSVSIYAKENDVLSKRHEKAFNMAIKKIVEVNGLDKSTTAILKAQLKPVISEMDNTQLKELTLEMESLEEDYSKMMKSNDSASSQMVQIESIGIRSSSSVIFQATYVGKGIAPLTGLMITMNQAGFDELIDLIAIGGPGAAAVQAFLIAQIGWWGTMLGVTIATYLLAQQFVIKYQLRRIGIATILV